MAAVVYLDTHVVAWLYAGESSRLGERAIDLVRTADLLVSPVVRLELQYLFEIGRTRVPASKVMQALSDSLGLGLCALPFARVVEEAERQAWTRDPFDRLIVAQASLAGAPLLTKDKTIQDHYARTVW